MSHRIQSIIFTLIVLLAVLWGGARESPPVRQLMDGSAEKILEQKSETANLTASADLVYEFVIPPPPISAAAALVKNLFGSTPLFVRNPHQQWPAASLTKLMTAVVAADKIPADAEIIASSGAIAAEGAAGNFAVGGRYRLEEILKALLVYSSNDAAAMLAEYYDRQVGGIGSFVEEMNRKAVSLGMYSTRYFDPHGLSPLNQSTAGDLEKLAHHIFNLRPEIFTITREREGNTHPFANFDNFLGGKTGFIDEANGNLVSLFNSSVDGQVGPLLIIVLGSEDRMKDTEELYRRYRTHLNNNL